MSWETLCSYDDIPDSTGAAALVEGHQIALFKVKGELYAIDNFDPFSKANVLSRGIIGSLKDEICVASPLYKQHFVLATGRCIEDETMNVRSYPVRCIDNKIELDTSSLALQAA